MAELVPVEAQTVVEIGNRDGDSVDQSEEGWTAHWAILIPACQEGSQ